MGKKALVSSINSSNTDDLEERGAITKSNHKT